MSSLFQGQFRSLWTQSHSHFCISLTLFDPASAELAAVPHRIAAAARVGIGQFTQPCQQPWASRRCGTFLCVLRPCSRRRCLLGAANDRDLLARLLGRLGQRYRQHTVVELRTNLVGSDRRGKLKRVLECPVGSLDDMVVFAVIGLLDFFSPRMMSTSPSSDTSMSLSLTPGSSMRTRTWSAVSLISMVGIRGAELSCAALRARP